MECREVKEYLPAYIDDAEGPRAQIIAKHLASCPTDCPAELERYRELQATMTAMRDEVHEPPAWLEGAITEAVSRRAARLGELRAHAKRTRDPKVVATAGAVLAAGVAGAILVRGMRRRRRRTGLRRWRSVLAQA